MTSLKRVVRILALISMFGALFQGLQPSVSAASPDITITQTNPGDCGTVSASISWSDWPEGYTVRILIDYVPFKDDVIDAGLVSHAYPIDVVGSTTWSDDYFDDYIGIWGILVVIVDEHGDFYGVATEEVDRTCLYGSVSPGGSSSDSDTVDVRSGVTSEPDDPAEADDPDNDGRVQVP